MYNRDLTPVNAESKSFEAVWQEVQKLPTDEKAQIVKRLLGKESGLIIVSTSAHLVDYIIAQMNLLSLEGLAYVLRAISARIASEGKASRG
jgi:hypothetical protein